METTLEQRVWDLETLVNAHIVQTTEMAQVVHALSETLAAVQQQVSRVLDLVETHQHRATPPQPQEE